MIEFQLFHIIQGIILPVLVIGSYLALRFEDLISAIIALASMSLLLALEFYLLHAPDVAIAEAGVGAGLTIAIYVLAIKKTERWIE